MIPITPDIKDKIELLDALLASYNNDELKQMVGESKVVDRLSGNPDKSGPLSTLLKEHTQLESRVLVLEAQLSSLDVDMKTLIKVINQTVFTPPNNSDFIYLKSNHGIW